MSSTTWLADISATPGRFTGQPQRGGRSDPDMAPTVRRNRQALEFAASGPAPPPGRPSLGRPPLGGPRGADPVSYTHLRAHETPEHLVCRLLLEKKKKTQRIRHKT